MVCWVLMRIWWYLLLLLLCENVICVWLVTEECWICWMLIFIFCKFYSIRIPVIMFMCVCVWDEICIWWYGCCWWLTDFYVMCVKSVFEDCQLRLTNFVLFCKFSWIGIPAIVFALKMVFEFAYCGERMSYLCRLSELGVWVFYVCSKFGVGESWYV